MGVLITRSSIVGGGGSLTNGSPFTITGSGFGTKPTAAPYFFENFESYANTAQPTSPPGASDTWQYDTSGSPGTTYRPQATTAQAFGGTKSCYIGLGDKVGGSENIIMLNTLSLTEAYVSYRARIVVNAAGSGNNQLKVGRILGDVHPYTSGPQYGGIHWISGAGGDYIETYQIDDPSGGVDFFGAVPNKNGASWNRFELYTKLTTAGSATGNRWYALNDSRSWTFSGSQFAGATADNSFAGKSGGNRITLGSSSDSPDIDLLMMPFYVTNGGGSDVDVWVDEVYLDTTQIRVEIGDNASYYSCTKRSPQPPTAWSNTSITITANQGDQTTSANAYGFVIAADGAITSLGLLDTWH